MPHKRSDKARGRSSRPDRAAPAEILATGVAFVIVDRDGRVLGASGWDETFGSPPARFHPEGGTSEPLLDEISSALAESRQSGAVARRYLEVVLDQRRQFAVAAGPLAETGRETAILVQEITGAFRVAPKEGQAIRDLGHDLRTPLTSMSGAVELLNTGRLGRLTPEQTRLLGMVQQGLELMLSLIDEATAPYRQRAADASDQAAAGGGGRA
jgi:signal transduction histidine kinase